MVSDLTIKSRTSDSFIELFCTLIILSKVSKFEDVPKKGDSPSVCFLCSHIQKLVAESTTKVS